MTREKYKKKEKQKQRKKQNVVISGTGDHYILVDH
jgi:hypothetical protein